MFTEHNKPLGYRDDEGDDEHDEEDIGPRRSRRSTRSRQMSWFIVSDDEHPVGGTRYPTRSRTKKPSPKSQPSASNGRLTRSDAKRAVMQARRAKRRTRGGWLHSPSSPDGGFDDAPHTSEDLEDGDMDAEGDADGDGGEAEQVGKFDRGQRSIMPCHRR